MAKSLLVDIEEMMLIGAETRADQLSAGAFIGDGDVERISSVLGQNRYSNILYYGPSGCGKTATIYGIIDRKIRISKHEDQAVKLPLHMLDRTFLMLDVNEMFSINDTQVITQKISRIFEKLEEPGNYILLIEDSGDLISGLENNQCNEFFPKLIAGLNKKKFQCLMMIRQEPGSNGLQKAMACNSEISELFSVIECKPPAKEQVIKIANATRKPIEDHFDGLTIDRNANEEIVNLTFQYPNLSIYTRSQPAKSLRLRDQIASIFVSRNQVDKKETHEEWVKMAHELSAIAAKRRKTEHKLQAASDKLDAAKQLLKDELKASGISDDSEDAINQYKSDKIREFEEIIRIGTDELTKIAASSAAIKASFNQRLVLGLDDVRNIFSELSGVPIKNLTADETTRAVGMAERLKKKIFGQDDAIDCISNAVLTARAGLNNPNSPIASFMIFGSSGIGKTYVCQKLAEDAFEDTGAITRLDMSEFQERHTISRIIGAPPGYAGFGDGGVLCNAIRRRPYQVILFDEIEKAHPDIFLILLQMLDSGRLSDELGTVDCRNTIIMMTTNLGGALSFDEWRNSDNSQDEMKSSARQIFPQELMNRVDSFLLFKALSKENIEKIISNQIKDKNENMEKNGRNVRLILSDEDIEAIVETQYKIEEGARQVQKFVQTNFINASAKEILLRGKDGGAVRGVYDKERADFSWVVEKYNGGTDVKQV